MYIRKTGIFIIQILILLIVSQCSSQTATTDYDLNKIENLIRIKDYDKALELSNDIIDDFPNNIMAYVYRARIYSALEQDDKSDQDLTHALKMADEFLNANPNDPSALYVKGAAYSLQDESEKAIKYLTKAIDSGGAPKNSYVLRAQEYIIRRSFDHAIDDLNIVIENAGEKTYLAGQYHNRGICYSHINEVNKAKEDFTTAIDLDPEYGEPYIAKAWILFEEGKWNESLQLVNKGLDQNLGWGKEIAYAIKGTIAFNNEKDLDKAIESLSKSLDINPEFSFAYISRGTAYMHKGDLVNAHTDFEKAVELEPGNADAHANLGVTLFAYLMDHDSAIREFDIALKLDPDNEIALKFKKMAEKEMKSKRK